MKNRSKEDNSALSGLNPPFYQQMLGYLDSFLLFLHTETLY